LAALAAIAGSGAARGDRVSWFYGVPKCSSGAKSHAEIAALVRDAAKKS